MESYAFQLVEANLWEWAVYVLLCSFCDLDSISKDVFQRKKLLALDVVLRHYTDDTEVDPLSNHRRSFLEEEVGIPVKWFEKAKALRYRYSLDPLGFLHGTSYYAQDALSTYEEILPDILFDGSGTYYQEVIDFLDSVKSHKLNEWDNLSLSGIMHDFLKLSQDVYDMSIVDFNGELSKDMFDELLVQTGKLQAKLPRPMDKKSNFFFNGITRVSQEICLAEISAALSAIVVHLNTVRQGCLPFELIQSSWSQTFLRGVEKTSELVFTWSNQTSKLSQLQFKGVIGARTILRGAYGV